MRRSNFPLRLSPSLFEEVRKAAKTEGIAINQLINLALAEKISAWRTEAYFEGRKARGDVPKALRLLKRAGVGKPPHPNDELPNQR